MARAAISGVLFLLGLLLAIVVGTLALASMFLGGGRLRWYSAWREVAARYKGIVDSAWWLPRLRFQWREHAASMRSVRRMAGLRLKGTLLESTAPEVNQELIVQSRHWPGPGIAPNTGQTPAIESSEISTESSLFDNQFIVVNSGNKRSGLELLGDSVAWQIMELAQWSGREPIRIEISRNKIRIMRSSFLKKAGEADDFLRLGLRVIDQLRTVKTEGLQFVNEDQATIMDDVYCPICTDRLTGNMVICVRCKTPHCRECWEYNGKCAMFACTETRCAAVGR